MNSPDTRARATEKIGHNLLGIHLDIQSLRWVEVNRGVLTAARSITYPPGIQPGKPGYAAFLKSALADVRELRHQSVWVAANMPSLQVRFLSLPKVRPRQLSNLVYWTYRKEIPFDAATTTFDFDVEGEVAAPGAAKKIDATAYTVAREDVDKLSAIFNEAGIDIHGMIIPSFAMRNVFRALTPVAGETVIGLHVGEDSSSIMFVRGRQIVAHRVFKTGMNSMLDVLRDRYPQWSPADAYHHIASAMQTTGAESSAPAASKPVEDAVRFRETVLAAYGRLVQQVERSVSAYLTGRSDEEIKRIFIAGSLNGFPRLMTDLGSRLGLTVQPLNGFDGAAHLPRTGITVSPEEGGHLAIALGAAISDPARTPNLLHTYAKREHEMRAARARKIISAVGAAGIVLLVGFHVALSRVNQSLREDLEFQRANMEKYAPYPDRAMILTLMGRAAIHSAQLKSMAERCLPVAVFNQLALNTPEDIRLTLVQLSHNEAASSAAARRLPRAPAANAAEAPLHLRVEGMVFGDTSLQESKLASFILRMEDADLFQRVALNTSTEGREGADPVLTFAMDMDVEPLKKPQLASLPLAANQGAMP